MAGKHKFKKAPAKVSAKEKAAIADAVAQSQSPAQ